MATYEVTVSGTSFAVSIAGVGQQGAAGAAGADLTFQGAWLTGTAFSVDDLVSNNGSTYACILNHTSSATDEPGVGANTDTYWTLFVEKGADGLGWTGGSYDAGTGVVTFTSDDGLDFVTGDLRGADGTGAGTVTSIDVAGGTGIDSSGGPVTSSGTITVGLDAATVASLDLADSAAQPDDVETTGIQAETGTAYTLALTDRGQVVTMNNAAANTVTIPTNASVAFDVGSVVTVIQIGAGVTTIDGDTGVTVNGTSGGSVDISAQYQGVSLLKIATDTWIASGAI